MKKSETKERVFYGVAKVKKAELISPSESQLMSYYIDYGYTTIEEVIDILGIQEMLREWYINTNFMVEFSHHQFNSNIFPIDWSSEYEDIDIVSEDEWKQTYEWNYGNI